MDESSTPTSEPQYESHDINTSEPSGIETSVTPPPVDISISSDGSINISIGSGSVEYSFPSGEPSEPVESSEVTWSHEVSSPVFMGSEVVESHSWTSSEGESYSYNVVSSSEGQWTSGPGNNPHSMPSGSSEWQSHPSASSAASSVGSPTGPSQ